MSDVTRGIVADTVRLLWNPYWRRHHEEALNLAGHWWTLPIRGIQFHCDGDGLLSIDDAPVCLDGGAR